MGFMGGVLVGMIGLFALITASVYGYDQGEEKAMRTWCDQPSAAYYKENPDKQKP